MNLDPHHPNYRLLFYAYPAPHLKALPTSRSQATRSRRMAWRSRGHFPLCSVERTTSSGWTWWGAMLAPPTTWPAPQRSATILPPARPHPPARAPTRLSRASAPQADTPDTVSGRPCKRTVRMLLWHTIHYSPVYFSTNPPPPSHGRCCGSGFTESGSSILSESGSVSDSWSRVLRTKNCRKSSWKLFFYRYLFWPIPIYLSLGLLKNVQATIHENPSALKREHQALKKMKIITFYLFLWAIFALLDPDPDCESGSESRDPLNPDPQH
jgi:hypothetical protein